MSCVTYYGTNTVLSTYYATSTAYSTSYNVIYSTQTSYTTITEIFTRQKRDRASLPLETGTVARDDQPIIPTLTNVLAYQPGPTAAPVDKRDIQYCTAATQPYLYAGCSLCQSFSEFGCTQAGYTLINTCDLAIGLGKCASAPFGGISSVYGVYAYYPATTLVNPVYNTIISTAGSTVITTTSVYPTATSTILSSSVTGSSCSQGQVVTTPTTIVTTPTTVITTPTTISTTIPTTTTTSHSSSQPTTIPSSSSSSSNFVSSSTGDNHLVSPTVVPKPSGLSTGAKAGIGAGAAVIALIVLGLIIYLCRKRNPTPPPPPAGPMTTTSATPAFPSYARQDPIIQPAPSVPSGYSAAPGFPSYDNRASQQYQPAGSAQPFPSYAYETTPQGYQQQHPSSAQPFPAYDRETSTAPGYHPPPPASTQPFPSYDQETSSPQGYRGVSPPPPAGRYSLVPPPPLTTEESFEKEGEPGAADTWTTNHIMHREPDVGNNSDTVQAGRADDPLW